ncbi:acid protease [Rickenella mellea]|uniref:Acid protease n=1 Tax=Rickenella mellea TaxID=50990 RepID=A0A4Y7PVC8_9AGAM|nr:acid protease [Rickenella mellea]
MASNPSCHHEPVLAGHLQHVSPDADDQRALYLTQLAMRVDPTYNKNGDHINIALIPITQKQALPLIRVRTDDHDDPNSRYPFSLALDTGSGMTWLKVDTHEHIENWRNNNSTTFHGADVTLTYGGGSTVSARLCDDHISIGPTKGVKTPNTPQVIGHALHEKITKMEKNDELEGILGIGPRKLTAHLTGKGEIPTVIDNYFQANPQIKDKIMGLYFTPLEADKGFLSLGDTANAKAVLKGEIHWVPRTKHSPAKTYYGFDMKISYGDHSESEYFCDPPIGPHATGAQPTPLVLHGVTDSGTTNIMLKPNILEQYLKHIDHTKHSNAMYSVTEEAFRKMKSLWFHLLDGEHEVAKLEFVPNAQVMSEGRAEIIPEALKIPGHKYLVFKALTHLPGVDFILGYHFLQRYYTAINFAGDNPETHTQGFALTEYTKAEKF